MAGTFSQYLDSLLEAVEINKDLILAVVGLAGVAVLVGIFLLFLKRRRAKRFDRELTGMPFRSFEHPIPQ